MSLKNKVAIITGSTGGIGSAIATALSKEGAKLVINSAKSADKGKSLAENLTDAIYIQANVANEKECLQLIDATIKHYGQLDIVINNAVAPMQRIPHQQFAAATDDMFLQNFSVNVMGAWYLSRAAFPYLQQSKDGLIINISSIAGIRPVGSSIPYSVSKAALNHLTHLLAKAMAPQVRVNAIAPGFIATERTANVDTEFKESLTSGIQLQRAGTPDEMAEAVLGIIRCKFMTGSIIVADGGLAF